MTDSSAAGWMTWRQFADESRRAQPRQPRWATLLHGDTPAAVEQVKRQDDGRLLIMGSAVLIHSLLPHNLIDEYRLAIHPLLLGGGVRLFPDDRAFHRLTHMLTRS